MEFIMWKKICLVLCMTIFLTGCVKVETDLTINKDGSAVVKERVMLSKQLLAMANDKDPFEDTLKKYENDPSVQVSDYEDAEMRGIEATRTIKDISDDKWNQKADTENVKSKNEDGKFVSVKKGFFKTVYTINSEIDTTEKASAPGLNSSASDMNAAIANGFDPSDFFKFNYIIKTPVKPDFHNATTANETENIYTWQIKFNTVNSLKMQFTVVNTVNIITAIIVLLVILGVILVTKNAPKEE